MTKEELKQKILKVFKVFNGREETIFDICWKEIAKLEKENAKLRSECRTCVYTDSPCVLSDYGKDKNGICDHFKNVFEENAELKNRLAQAKEIIKKFSEFANNEIEYDPEHPQEHTDLWNKLCEQAEQFLKEIEK